MKSSFHKLFSITIILVFSTFNTFCSYATIYETTANGSWNSSSIWTPSKPSMGWGFTDTIYIKHNVSLNGNKSIHGFFKVTSTGQLTGASKSLTVKDDGKFVNDGTISIKNLTMDWEHLGGENNGTITLSNNFTNREGTFTNNGTLNVGATFNNSYDGIFSNPGTLNVTGTFKNYHSFTSVGDITVGGSFTNYDNGTINMSGDLDVTGNMKNKGTATMSGEIAVGGNFTNDWSATFSSSNDLAISGNLANKGPFTNTGTISCVNFTNEDNFTSSGTSNISGNVINKDEMTNSGNMNITGNFTNKWSSCDLTNSGNITIDGDATNNGDIDNNSTGTLWVKGELDNDSNIDNDGDVFIDDVLAGSGNINGDGAICNSDGVTDPNNSKANNVTCSTCGNGGLPVELISFEAKEIDNFSAKIYWSTASEEKNDYFEVLSSDDGIDFKTIAKVTGNGYSNIILNYEFIDNNLKGGITYYKLKQVDFDGKSTFTNIIFINNKDKDFTNIYPNPVSLGQEVFVKGNNQSKVVEIYDVSGKLIKVVELNDKSNEINTSDMKKGIYILRIIANDSFIIKRLIIN